MIKERTLGYASRVVLPEDIPVADKGFKECCFELIVFGDTLSSDDYKNDFSGFFHKRQTTSETCNFILRDINNATDYPITDDTYGRFVNFGGFPDPEASKDLKIFIVDWKKVIDSLGVGSYNVTKDTVIGGLPFTVTSNTFKLRQFTIQDADKTCRIDSVMEGRLVHFDADFSRTGFKTSMRVQGFFGRRKPKYEEDNIVYRDYESVQISMTQDNEYTLQTNLLPDCITKEILDFILFGNDLFVNDYNKNNHSYGFIKFPVKFDKSNDPKYGSFIRDVVLEFTFTDKFKNKRKINDC